MIEIKKCHCGAKGYLRRGYMPYYSVCCSDPKHPVCGQECKTKEEAIKAWNRWCDAQ